MRSILLALLLSAATAAAAQSQAPPDPAEACTDLLFRQFDFWIGDWDVFAPTGNKAGENSIRSEEYGCLLVERWTSANGTTGQSYNYVDRATGKWRQIWVAYGSTIDYSGGLNDKGQMVLEGTIAYAGGKTAPFRGTWTPNANGTVTQHFEQYDETKKAWGDWFVGTYKRQTE
jgi:hypothetical protein